MRNSTQPASTPSHLPAMVGGLGTCVWVCNARGHAVGAHTATDVSVKVIFTPSGSTAGFECLGIVTSVISVNEESLDVFVFDRIVVVRFGIHCCGSYALNCILQCVYVFFQRSHIIIIQ